MYSIIYESEAHADFSSTAIFKMLLGAKNYNREHGITGCIIFYKGVFLQLLEGAEEEVEKLFGRIKVIVPVPKYT